mmetsp:Transcript_24625/g.36905  ORF Transcript_24625/g.36905 Transcript_24625/m.36905 type:complete len:191 (-) Transcript_24625:195-767(-)
MRSSASGALFSYFAIFLLSACLLGVSVRSARETLGKSAALRGARLANARLRLPNTLPRGISAQSSSLRAGAKRGIVACSELDLIREVVGKDSYESTLKDAGDKLVLVDFYTDWCGPCKMIYPYLEELARENSGSLEIVKVNCAGENRELVNELGVRVLPTFMFYKNEKNVAIVKGAKRDDLKSLIAEHTA